MKKDETPSLELTAPGEEIIRPAEDPFDQVSSMMRAIVKGDITEAKVGALEKLTDLFQKMDAKRSEKLFNESFNLLQQELPKIQATEPVPNKDGSLRYKFAPYESIMDAVAPVLVRHGFTVSFSTRYDQGRIIKICHLRHRAGHAVTNEFAVRVGHGPPGASEAQADGAAGTYAKRMALCDCLNIVVEKDTDARELGDVIDKHHATELQKRVQQTASDEIAFLKFAQAQLPANPTREQIDAAYLTIPEAMYPTLDSSLKKKEDTRGKK